MDFHNLKRRELQALCKKHTIPANLTNLEMANQLTSLLTGNEKPLTQGPRSCLKGLEENASVKESDVENRPAKKVRFSPQNEMIEFEKSVVKYLERRGLGRKKSGTNNKCSGAMENGTLVTVVDKGVGRVTRSRRVNFAEGSEVENKGGKRGMKDNAFKNILPSTSGVVENRRDAVMVEGAGRVTRSRKVKLIEGSEIESKGGKRGIKGDALKCKLPSAAADNVPLVDATNEEHVVVGKRSLRKRSLRNRVVDVERKENYIVEKCSRKNEEHVVVRKRSLRNIELKEKTKNEDLKKGSRTNGSHRKDNGCKDIAGTKATKEESEGIQAEKVLRRSRRHVAEVDYHNMVHEDMRKNEKVGRGRWRSMVAVEVKESSGVDNISRMVVNEGSPVDNKVRRSKRNATKPEGLVTRERIDEVANANDKNKTKNRRRDAILHEQAVKVDGNSVDRPRRWSTRNTERSERVAPKIVREKVAQKEKGRSKKTKGKVEDSFTEEILKSEDLPASEAELTMPEVAKDTIVDNLNDTVIDLAGFVSDFEGADASQSNLLRQDQDPASVSGTLVKNVDSPFTDKGIQKKAPGTDGKSVHPPSDDNDVQKEGQTTGGETYTDEKRKGGNGSKKALYMRKTPLAVTKNNMARQRVCSDVSLNDAIDELNELGRITENMISETVEGCTSDAERVPVNNADYIQQEGLSSTMHSIKTLKQREELTLTQRNGCEAHNLSAEETKLDHHELNFFEYDKEDFHPKVECSQPNADSAYRRSAMRKLQDGNVGSGEEINRPVDLQGRLLEATAISVKVVETVAKFSESGSDSKRLEPPKSNLVLGFLGESLNTMDLEPRLELRTKSPSEEGKGVEAEVLEDGQNLLESFKHEEVVHLKHQDYALDHSWQSHELNSARNKFSILQDQGGTNSEDSVAISDAKGVILLLHSECTQITEGAKCTKIELSASKSSSISTTPANSSAMLKYQPSDTNTENEHCPLTDDNAENQEYGGGNEVERKEDSVPMQESYRIKMPSTSEDDDSERCSRPLDGSFKRVTGMLNDQLDSMEEGMEPKENFESGFKSAMEDLHESFIGKECGPINLEKSNYIELENHHNLIAVSEVATSGIIDDCLPVAVHTPLKNTDENHQGEHTSSIKSGKTLKQKEESTLQLRNSYEAHSQSALETILDHHELYLENAKSDGDGHSEGNTSDKYQESVPDASRRSTRKMLQDENVHGESFVEPSDLLGTVFMSTPMPATTVETVIDFSEGTSDFNRVESPKANFKFEFTGEFTDNVGLDKQSVLRTQSPISKQGKGVDEGFVVEPYTELEDGQKHIEVFKFQEVRHLKGQETVFDDCAQHAKLNSSARSKLSFKQDHGVCSTEDTAQTAELYGAILSPSSVASQIIERRFREIELSAKKSSSMSSAPNFINLKSASTNSGREQSLFANDNVQNQGHRAWTEGERIEACVPVQDLYMIQIPSTSKDDGLEGGNICIDGSLYGVIDVLNDVQGSIAESIVPNGNCVSGSEAYIEKEMQESFTGEKGSQINLEANNNNEPETVYFLDAALEVTTTGTLDSCTSHAAQTPSKNSNGNKQGEKLEILSTEPINVSSSREEKNTFSHEKEMELEIMSMNKIHSPGRDGWSCQSDEVFSREEQEKYISSHEHSVDAEKAVENEIQSTTEQNIFPNAADGTTDGWNFSGSWHGDELKMLFDSSVVDYEDNILQERHNGAFFNSNSHVASDEYKERLVLKGSIESNGTRKQHDEQKNGDLKVQKGIEVGEDNQTGAEVHIFSSLKMIATLEQSKGDESFSLDQNKDVEEETGTSLAVYVREQVTMPEIDAEVKVTELDIQDPAAGSVISKSHDLLKESVVDAMIDYSDSKSTKSPLSTNDPSNTSDSDVLTEVAELTPLIAPEAENVEETVDAASQNETPPAEEQEQGQAREEANHQSLENARGGIVLEDTWVLHSKTNSSSSKNLDPVAGENIKLPAKQFVSTVNKKNARTVLIHGTPNKLQMTAHMKENASNSKIENIGTWTTVRPAAKRSALKDLLQK